MLENKVKLLLWHQPFIRFGGFEHQVTRFESFAPCRREFVSQCIRETFFKYKQMNVSILQACICALLRAQVVKYHATDRAVLSSNLLREMCISHFLSYSQVYSFYSSGKRSQYEVDLSLRWEIWNLNLSKNGSLASCGETSSSKHRMCRKSFK